jgi:hypothetical protein
MRSSSRSQSSAFHPAAAAAFAGPRARAPRACPSPSAPRVEVSSAVATAAFASFNSSRSARSTASGSATSATNTCRAAPISCCWRVCTASVSAAAARARILELLASSHARREST